MQLSCAASSCLGCSGLIHKLCCASLQADKLALLPGSCVCNLHPVAAEPQCPARHDWLHGGAQLREQGLAHPAALYPHQRRSVGATGWQMQTPTGCNNSDKSLAQLPSGNSWVCDCALLDLPCVAVGAGVAGLLGAAFNSMRMWLWRLRASKTRHLLRIGEVRGMRDAAGDSFRKRSRAPSHSQYSEPCESVIPRSC
jgi:hypothetical protein